MSFNWSIFINSERNYWCIGVYIYYTILLFVFYLSYLFYVPFPPFFLLFELLNIFKFHFFVINYIFFVCISVVGTLKITTCNLDFLVPKINLSFYHFLDNARILEYFNFMYLPSFIVLLLLCMVSIPLDLNTFTYSVALHFSLRFCVTNCDNLPFAWRNPFGVSLSADLL